MRSITSRGRVLRRLPRPSRDACIITGLLIFHLIANIWFLSVDSGVLRDSAGSNYVASLRLFNDLARNNLLGKVRSLYLGTLSNVGPTYIIPLTGLMALLGKSADSAAFTNTLFLAMLVIALYLLGTALFDRKTGLLAAICITFYPAIFSLARSVEARLSLVAMVVLALWALVKSEGFSSRKHSLFFGIFSALAALTKPEFSLFLAVPFLAETGLAAVSLLRAKKTPELRKCGLNLLIAGGVLLLLTLPWYIHHIGPYFAWHNKTHLGHANPEGLGLILHPEQAFLLGRDLLSDFVLGLFIVSLPIFLAKARHRMFLLGWILLPFLFFFLLLGRDVGCVIQGDVFAAMLPAIALVVAFSLSHLPRGRVPLFPQNMLGTSLTILVVCVVVLAHVALYFGVTFSSLGGLPFLRDSGFLSWARFGCVNSDYFYTCDSESNYCLETDSLNNRAPSTSAFSFDLLYDNLPEKSVDGDSPPRIFVFDWHGEFTNSLLTSLRQHALLAGREPFQEPSCLDLGRLPGRGLQEIVGQCKAELFAADIVILERLAYRWGDCHFWPQYVPALNELVPDVLSLLPGYEIVYTVRLQPPLSRAYSPTTTVYVRSEGDASWSREDWRLVESSDHLFGIVLVRTDSKTEWAEKDIGFLKKWLTITCDDPAETNPEGLA